MDLSMCVIGIAIVVGFLVFVLWIMLHDWGPIGHH